MDTGSQIFIEFSQPVYEISSSLAKAFSVIGNEVDPMYNGAPMQSFTYPVAECTLLEDQKTLQLTMSSSFRNVVGNLTVKYDDTVGYIAGNGGIVLSFSRTFTPEQLKPLYNPGAVEYINIRNVANLVPIKVSTRDINTTDNITISCVANAKVTAIKSKATSTSDYINVRSMFSALPTLVGTLTP